MSAGDKAPKKGREKPGLGRRGRMVALALLGIGFVIVSTTAVVLVGAGAIGALLGILVVLAVLALVQQQRYARRAVANLSSAASAERGPARASEEVAALSRDIASLSRDVGSLSKDVGSLSRAVTTWSKDAKAAEIETGLAALNRYVALSADEATEKG